jgi:hypothetical protein
LFTFGNFSNTAEDGNTLGLGLTQVGFTLLSRRDVDNTSYPLDIRATITFSDASTSVVTTTLADTKGTDDTFMSFTAASG